jgi:hypothetical protein
MRRRSGGRCAGDGERVGFTLTLANATQINAAANSSSTAVSMVVMFMMLVVMLVATTTAAATTAMTGTALARAARTASRIGREIAHDEGQSKRDGEHGKSPQFHTNE